MKIAHVNLAKGWGGGEIQTLTLARTLRKIAPEITSVFVVRKNGEFAQRLAESREFPFVEASNHFRGHFAAALAGVDLTHAHDGRAPYWCWIHKKIKSSPYLITRRVPNLLSGSFFSTLVYRGAAALVALSKSIAKSFPAGSEFLTIPSSWLDNAVSPERALEIRREREGFFLVVHPATLTPVKNHKTVLRAARVLQSRGEAIRFLILGKGPLESELKAESRDLRNVEWLGHKENISDYMQAADAVILPSVVEGLGSSVLEAYHRGKPVVAGNVDGLPEIVSEETGFLIEPTDADSLAERLLRMKNDVPLYEKLRAGAVRAAEKYSPEKNAERYLELYGEISR